MEYVARFTDLIIYPAMYLLFTAGFFLFVWGLIEFLWKVEEVSSRQQGVQHMTWGIVGMFIMVGVWGIINIMIATFDLEIDTSPYFTPSSNPQTSESIST